MTLFLATFIVDHTPYMGDRKKGQRDFRLIWAPSEKEAHEKLEAAVAPHSGPGDDSYWLHSVEIHEAIE